MACTNPIECFLPSAFDFEGKRHLVFSKTKLYQFKKATIRKFENAGLLPSFHEDNFLIFDEKNRFPDLYIDNKISDPCPDGYLIQVPCGKCLGCRLDYSRLWATRAVNEAMFYDYYKNCSFLSLTFNEQALRNTNLGYSVDKAFFRSWVKRLRFAVKDKYGIEFRHMSCGEYGSKRGRPHYHMIIFGFNFPDKVPFKSEYRKGKAITYYRSPFLESLWRLPHSSESAGFTTIGEVNFETCAYVARYVTKKLSDKSLYGDQQPEFLSVSRMPGLGYNYCTKYLDTIFSSGFVSLPNGFKSSIPRYYESICEKLNPELYYNYKYEKFKKLHEEMLKRFRDGSNPDKNRYLALNESKTLRTSKLLRSYEDSINI